MRRLLVLLLLAGCTAGSVVASPVGLLHAAPNGDGDSWKDTAGHEYRLGLVNTPELGECYGQRASAERKQLVRMGFRADVYSRDTHGRLVAVVYLADGTNLNVFLARHGYANDRYLAQFRHENPALAAELDTAFAAARRERAGLWRSCS
jgi:endonuclease YncB( thermonuclease family)